MARVLLSRILWIVGILLAVSVITFTLIHLAGDPTDGFVEPGAPPEVRAQIRTDLGLDQSLPIQYLHFLQGAIHGDFGESWRAHQPALDLVLDRLPATLALAGLAAGLALFLGLILGITAARARNHFVRATANAIISLGQAIPSFWLGATLVLIFAVRLEWLPSSGKSGWTSLILPAVTLAIQPASLLARLIATQLSETLDADYIRTARSKGLTEPSVVMRHALRSTVGPLLALLAIQTGFLIGGAVVVEGVFAYPGIGLLALNAVQDRDLPVIQSFVIVIALLITLLTLAVDLLSKWLDPRLREVATA